MFIEIVAGARQHDTANRNRESNPCPHSKKLGGEVMWEQLVTQDIGDIVRGHQTAPNARPPRGQQMLLVYDFMREFFRENDQLPPCRVIADKFGFASLNAAQTHLDSLARRGLIEKNAVGKWRFARGQKEAA